MSTIVQRNNVQVFGRGQASLVFAHGFGCDQHMWRHVAPAFESDYRTVLFDHVGAGKSDATHYDVRKYSSLHGYAHDVIEICKELKLERTVFIGHSVSAMVGVLAARLEPALFDKLILVGPSPRYVDDGDYRGGFSRADIDGLLASLEDNFVSWANVMAPVIMGNADRPELGRELSGSFCRTNPDIAKHFARVTFLSDNRADLAHLSVPTLVLQCSQDPIAPAFVGEYVHLAVRNSTFRTLKATGHCPNMSAPQETIDAIRSFL